METRGLRILTEYLAIVALTLPAALGASAPGNLVLEGAGACENAFYVSEGKKLLIETSDDGLLFYRDGVQWKEPPLHVAAELYRRRTDDSNVGQHSCTRARLLKNGRYKQLFTAGSNSAPASLVVDSSGVFEVVGGKRSRILTLDGGRIMAEDTVTLNGVYWKSYRALHPDVLKQLMDRYATVPENYKSILANENNQKDLAWWQARASAPQAAPAVQAPVVSPANAGVSNPSHAPEKSAAPARTSRPIADPIVSSTASRSKAKMNYPDWVRPQDRASYKQAAEDHPMPKQRASNQDGLPQEYNELRDALDRQSMEISRLMAVGSDENTEDKEMDKWRKAAESIHRFWAKYLAQKGGVERLSPQEKARYDADLEDFEYIVIGARVNKLLSEYLDKKIAAHEAKYGPPKGLFRNVNLTLREEEMLQQKAVDEVVAQFRSNPVEFAETMARLAALSKLPLKANPERMKYPKLRLYLLQIAAGEFLNPLGWTAGD